MNGLFEAHKKEDCEVHLAQSIRAEVQKLWDRMVVHVQQFGRWKTATTSP